MFSTEITYRVGLERIADLRHEADDRRRAGVVRGAADRVRAIAAHGQRGQLSDTRAMLRPRRPARA